MIPRTKAMAGALLAAVLASATAGPVLGAELDVLYAWPGHSRFHDPVAEAYMAENTGTTIAYRAAASSYDEAIQMLIRQKLAGDLPDIHYAGYHLLRELKERGLIQPIEDLISQEDMDRLGYEKNVLDLAKVDGVQYGMPLTMSTMVVYYNADLVERVGGDPSKLPDDWDGLIELGAKIDALGKDTFGFYYEVGAEDWTTQTLFMNHAAPLLTDDGKDVAFNGPKGKAAIALFQRFHDEAGQPAISRDEARQLFWSGNLGFYFSSPAGISAHSERVGDRFPVKVAPVPLASPNATFPTGGMAAVIITEDPERRTAAWNFIKFATGPKGQTIIVPRSGYMPTNRLATENGFLADFYKEDPRFYVSVTQIPRARPWKAWPGANNVEIGRTIKDHMEAIANGAEPMATLAKMADDVRALLPPK